MTPTEVSIIMEAKRPKRVGGIHEDDIDDMIDRMEKLRRQGVEVI